MSLGLPRPPSRLFFALRFLRLGWKGTPGFHKVLLGVLLPAWAALVVPVMLSGGQGGKAALVIAFVGALTALVLFQLHKDGHRHATKQAAASIARFLPLVDAVLDQKEQAYDIWEIAPTIHGGFKAGLWTTDYPGADTGFRILPMPSWIAGQALFLAQQEGLRDARPLREVGPMSRWTRALGRHRKQSAHARLAARQALRDALAPHLREAFDADPL